MTLFKTTPTCEHCKTNDANSFVLFGRKDDLSNGKWKYLCGCTPDSEAYVIELDRFFSKPAATVDWLAHMHEKTWINWKDFMDMMTRFRKASESFHAL